MNNPYVARGPLRNPEMFYGRADELSEIAAFLNGNQSVSIVGPRRIGKTSLLYHLMRPDTWHSLGMGRDNLFVYLDSAILAGNSQQEIFAQFSSEMRIALHTQGQMPEPALETAIATPTRIAFEAAVRKLNQRGLRVVMILDEFELLSTNSQVDVNFFNSLRSGAGRLQLAFLTASAQPLLELTYSTQSQEILSSPFFNIFAQIFLGLLAEGEARALIRTPMEGAGVVVDDQLEDFVYELVGGHPLGLQMACFHAFGMPDDFAEIQRRTLYELGDHLQYYWNHLSPTERDVLGHLSDAVQREGNDPTIRVTLRDLMRKCLLIRAQTSYDYPSRAWAEFVRGQPSAPADLSTVPSGPEIEPHEVAGAAGRGGIADPVEMSDVQASSKGGPREGSGRLWRESLPEAIGGISVAVAGGLAALVYKAFGCDWTDKSPPSLACDRLPELGIWTLILIVFGFLAVGVGLLWLAFKPRRK